LGDKSAEVAETHLFAPDNATMIKFVRKNDRKGLGHDCETKLTSLNPITAAADDNDDDGDDDAYGAGVRSTSILS
jgi:G patch domain-containing protein 1